MCSTAPQRVSSDFGQLAVSRHLISGIDCAIAGAAMLAAPAVAIPVTFRKSLRFMNPALRLCVSDSLLVEAWDQHGTTGSRIPSGKRSRNAKKPGLLAGDRASPCRPTLPCMGFSLFSDQPRVRERIMKVSKVYSATCHHKYWSER